MGVEITTVVSIISVSFAIFFGLKNNKRNDTSDIERKAAEAATINFKLDQIGRDVQDIKYDITTTKKEVQLLTERMVAVEQSVKSAHKRFDDLEKVG